MQFFLTDAGRNAIIDQKNLGYKIALDRIVLGQEKYDAKKNAKSMTSLVKQVADQKIAGGIAVEKAGELRLNALINSKVLADIFEIGILDDNGILFAVCSTTGDTPIVRLTPNVGSILAVTLTIQDIQTSDITINVDANSPLALALMTQHIQADDPHPQYRQLSNELAKRIEELENRVIEDTKVGELFFTELEFENSQQVANFKGYGRWAKWGSGQHLVAQAQDGNRPEFMRKIGSAFGEDMHHLTEAELPHIEIELKNSNLSMGGYAGDSGRNGGMTAQGWGDGNQKISFGNNQGFRQDPFSIVVGVWVRLPDIEPEYNFTASVERISENTTFKVFLDVKNLPQGKQLNYSVSGIDSSEISPSTGSFTLDSIGHSEVQFSVKTLNTHPTEKDITFALTNGKGLINIPKNMPDAIQTAVHVTSGLISLAGMEETTLNITNSCVLYDLFIKDQNRKPMTNETAYFVIHENVAIIGTNTQTPALKAGTKWASSNKIIVDNYGFILGRGGNSGYNNNQTTKIQYDAGGDALVNDSNIEMQVINRNWIAGGGGAGGYELGTGASGAGAPYGLPDARAINAETAKASFRTGGVGNKSTATNFSNGKGGNWGQKGEDGYNDYPNPIAHDGKPAGRALTGNINVTQNSGNIKGSDQ